MLLVSSDFTEPVARNRTARFQAIPDCISTGNPTKARRGVAPLSELGLTWRNCREVEAIAPHLNRQQPESNG
jgi:hypothetical protein